MFVKFSTFSLVFYVFYQCSHFLLPSLTWISSWTLLLCIAWKGSHYLTNRFILSNYGVIDGKGKAVLITGCDTGFGNLLALRLNKLGFHVFAGCLNIESLGAQSLKEKATNRRAMQLIKLDVTKSDDIAASKKTIDEDLINLKLTFHGLVNNAGIAEVSPIEWHSDSGVEDFAKVFDVNFFGLVRTTRTFLPLLRKSKGRVVNLTSAGGRNNVPFMGRYSASKHAAVAFTETLQLEVGQFGVKAISVEPAGYKTPMADYGRIRKEILSKYKKSSEEVREAYGVDVLKVVLGSAQAATSEKVRSERLGDVIEAIIDGLTSFEPNSVYVVMNWLLRAFNIVVFEWMPREVKNLLIRSAYNRMSVPDNELNESFAN